MTRIHVGCSQKGKGSLYLTLKMVNEDTEHEILTEPINLQRH